MRGPRPSGKPLLLPPRASKASSPLAGPLDKRRPQEELRGTSSNPQVSVRVAGEEFRVSCGFLWLLAQNETCLETRSSAAAAQRERNCPLQPLLGCIQNLTPLEHHVCYSDPMLAAGSDKTE